jgi:hypothetical protein
LAIIARSNAAYASPVWLCCKVQHRATDHGNRIDSSLTCYLISYECRPIKKTRVAFVDDLAIQEMDLGAHRWPRPGVGEKLGLC